MRKGWVLVIIVICAGLLCASGILTAQDFQSEIVIDGKGYKKDIKGPVNFNHANHAGEYGAQCEDCHHNYVDGKNTWQNGDEVKKCSTCHDVEKSEGNVKKLMMAYHNNCQGCHEDKVKEGKKAPDKKCETCHK
jgi:predicted CXXCH cytochrome family protein